MSVAAISSCSSAAASSASGPSGPRKHHGPSQKDLASALESAGASDSDTSDIIQQIQQAVEAAKVNGDGQSGSSIRDAINGVLQANGVDVQAFEQALHAERGGPPGGPTGDAPQDGVSALFSSGLSDDQISQFLDQVKQLAGQSNSASDTDANSTDSNTLQKFRDLLTQFLQNQGYDPSQLQATLSATTTTSLLDVQT